MWELLPKDSVHGIIYNVCGKHLREARLIALVEFSHGLGPFDFIGDGHQTTQSLLVFAVEPQQGKAWSGATSA